MLRYAAFQKVSQLPRLQPCPLLTMVWSISDRMVRLVRNQFILAPTCPAHIATPKMHSARTHGLRLTRSGHRFDGSLRVLPESLSRRISTNVQILAPKASNPCRKSLKSVSRSHPFRRILISSPRSPSRSRKSDLCDRRYSTTTSPAYSPRMLFYMFYDSLGLYPHAPLHFIGRYTGFSSRLLFLDQTTLLPPLLRLPRRSPVSFSQLHQFCFNGVYSQSPHSLLRHHG